jgi:peptide/nickel transport system substrate-binding protein
MKHSQLAAQSLLLMAMASLATTAVAQKAGGTLRMSQASSPSSASLLEESSANSLQPFMPVFNNLVVYDQQDKVVRPESIVPDLATEWSWSPDNLVLTMKLRQGVAWHDGKPFTSADVQCTWEMILEKRPSNWRKNGRKEWYDNLKDVSVTGPYEVRFTLARPQASFLSLLASGWSPVYPCHVDGRAMRQKPIGTGPFKVVEYKANHMIRLAKNPDYWKPGRPYLDGLEYRIVPSGATRVLEFIAGQIDVTGGAAAVTSTGLKDIRAGVPNAVCETNSGNVTAALLINTKAAPFDNPKLRRAISFAIDRRAFVQAMHGDARLGGIIMSPPDGAWGLTPEQLESVPGFGKDVARNREEARKIMRELGYGPDKPLKTTFMVRATSETYRAGVLLAVDQLRTIFIDGTVDAKDYSVVTSAYKKGAYTMAFERQGSSIDDPDNALFEGYKCGAVRNYTHYCTPEIEAKIDEQSSTIDPVLRKKLVQALDLRLQQEGARVVLYQGLSSACWHSYVKGYVRPANGNYTHHRMEDVWLEK